MTLLIFASLLTSAAFYLGSRAKITAWLWSRYPRKLAVFFDCAACTGFWFGILVGLLYRHEGLSPTGIPASEWYSPVLIGLASIVWTPIVAGLMQAGFERLGSAIEDEGGVPPS